MGEGSRLPDVQLTAEGVGCSDARGQDRPEGTIDERWAITVDERLPIHVDFYRLATTQTDSYMCLL